VERGWARANLIKNAIEAHVISDAEFRPGRVNIHAAREGGSLVVTITDTGQGISHEDLKDIMEFVPGRSSKGERGSGFGLPLAHLYIEEHEGTLEFTSALGEGTTATVRIPFSREIQT